MLAAKHCRNANVSFMCLFVCRQQIENCRRDFDEISSGNHNL